MIDVNVLRGSSVRAPAHKLEGRISSVSLPWVKIGWNDKGLVAREESYLRSDPFLDEEVEVLTLPEGWIPLGRLLGAQNLNPPAPTKVSALVTDLRGLLNADGAKLDEAALDEQGDKAHSPFKTAAKTFIGPRGGWFHKFPGQSKGRHMNRHHKQDVWDCSSEGPYKQVCTAVKDVPEQGITKGMTKHVTQPESTKAKYNKEYKAFQAASRAKSSRKTLLRQMAAKEKGKAKPKAKLKKKAKKK